MKFLVTGGLGAIGSMLTRQLIEEGHKVVVYDICPEETTLVKDILNKIDLVSGDVTDLRLLIDTMKEKHIERVIHCAALLDVMGQSHPSNNIQNNVVGSLTLFEACRLMGIIRVVYCSSRGVYQDKSQGMIPEPITEECPRIPRVDGKLYDISKLFIEYLAETYRRKYGLECIGMRFAPTFGPGKKLTRHGYHAIISMLIENAIAGKPTKIQTGGEQKNDYVYNRDIARALIAASLKSSLKHYIFHIGTGEAVSLFEVAAAIRQVIPQADIDIGPGVDFLGTGGIGYAVFDISRARAELGFEPQYPIVKAVRDYIDVTNRLDLLRLIE